MYNRICPYCLTGVEEGTICPKCGLPQETYVAPSHHLPPGTLLANRYVIGRALGEGGFGITYLGKDVHLNMKVAIKEYFPSSWANRISESSLTVTHSMNSDEGYNRGKQRFIQEAQAMARMEKQPEIVSVRDFFEANGTAYIAMEYVSGTTLKYRVHQLGRISAEELLPLMRPLLEALDRMHQAGLIHRDISPDNLMIENGRLRLLDFGCAKETTTGNAAMTVMLKQGFSPLEQYQQTGQGPWTDVYAISATMYYCLTGKVPSASIGRLVNDDLIPPRELGADLNAAQEAALLRGMAVKREERFSSVRELLNALYEIEPETPVSPQSASEDNETAAGTPQSGGDEKPARPKWLIPVIAAAVILVIILIAVFAFGGSNNEEIVWATYTNEDAGFSINYPDGLTANIELNEGYVSVTFEQDDWLTAVYWYESTPAAELYDNTYSELQSSFTVLTDSPSDTVLPEADYALHLESDDETDELFILASADGTGSYMIFYGVSASSKKYDSYMDICEEMAASFKLTGTEAAAEEEETAEETAGEAVYSGTAGENVTWSFEESTYTLTISGSGEMDSWEQDDERPWETLISDAQSIVIEDGITSLGSYAFASFSSVTAVSIPSSVTSIGCGAFDACSGLSIVYYGGTAAEWAAIAIDSGNDLLTGADIICDEEEEEEEEEIALNSDIEWVTYTDEIGYFTVSYPNGCDIETDEDGEDYSSVLFSTDQWEVGIYYYGTQTASEVYEGYYDLLVSEGYTPSDLTDTAVLRSDYTYGMQLDIEGEIAQVFVIEGADSAACYAIVIETLDTTTETRDYPALCCTIAESFQLFSGVSSWSYDESTCTLTIRGNGAMDDWSGYEDCPWESYSYDTKKIVIEEGITSIGSYAFFAFWNAEEVSIPSTVTSIGYAAFYACEMLTTITIPSGVTAIENQTFCGCAALTEITIPASVTSVDYYAFDGCDALTTVYYEGTAEQWAAISIHSSGNDPLTAASLICSG